MRTPEQVQQLVADILTVIQQMEVGKGGSATESNYRTSSGVRASYASRMQATIPWCGLPGEQTWDDDKVAWAAFKRQNGAADYAGEALQIFKKLHPAPTPAPPAPTTPAASK